MSERLDHHLVLLDRQARALGVLWAIPLVCLTFLLVGGAIPQQGPRPDQKIEASPRVVVASASRTSPRVRPVQAQRAKEAAPEIQQLQLSAHTDTSAQPVLRPLEGTVADTDFSRMSTLQSLREMEEALRDIRQTIALSKLDAVPRLVVSPPFPYPRALTRRGVLEGKVVFHLRISMEGEPRVLEILSADHPLLAEAALRWLDSCRFTRPSYRGKATEARGRWTVTFASQKR